ncbi:4091_t:CDS:2, partial [Gigaspora margarita]
MGRISPLIKKNAKVTILGTVIGEKIARPLVGDMWKTKRLSAIVLRAASGTNRWVIKLDANPEIEIEVSAGRMKFVASATPVNNNLNDENSDIPEELVLSEAETNFSSDSEQSDGEQDSAVGIDSRRVHQSYTNSLVVNISDIANASPRQFFEHFLPVEYLMSTVIPSTNKRARECERRWQNLTWMELMRFFGVLTVMTYVQCADIRDYWSVTQETYSITIGFGKYISLRRFRDIIKYITLTDIPMDNNNPFHLIRKFHNAFNKNLSEAIIPGNFLCIDESMCQWMANLFLHLDPVEPPEHSSKKKFSEYLATIATMLRLTEPWFNSGRTIIADSWFGSVVSSVTLYKHGFYSILQLKKRCYWPKNIPHDITDALGSDYGSFVCRTGNLDGVELAFRRPAIFEEFNGYRSAIDILNNLHDNAFSYHDALSTKHSENHILAFYLTVAEANSYSAYCQFVPGKKNMKHVDFRKKLVASIFNYYKEEVFTETVAS